MGKKQQSKRNDKKIIETALKRFNLGLDADSKNRQEAITDMKFRSGDQWPEVIKKQRELENKPCLTVNKMPQNVHKITGDQRQNRQAIKVSPFDDNADIETAEVIQGMVRSIENISNAETAYDMGFDSAVTGGRGFFRIITEFADAFSFDQIIKIKSILDPHSVVLDPNYREPDGSDANWGFCYEDIPKDDFEDQYPDAEVLSDAFDWGTLDKDWFKSDSVRVTEYFVKEFSKETIVLLPDNSVVLKTDLDALDEKDLEALGLTKESIEDLKTRETMIPKVMWYKMNGNEILERTKFGVPWIPIIPIHGEELYVDGERIFEGIIRQARDPQRMYNYWATCETETIALAPKAPWVGAEGQFEGHEQKWDTANTKNYAYLEYKPTSIGGNLVAPPQRQFAEPAVQAITNARMLSSEDLKTTVGIYDASVGAKSNEISGRAINTRDRQAQTGNFHYIDNLSRSLSHAGRIIGDLIPIIYDTDRMVRILGEDDEAKIIRVNAHYKDDKGKDKMHDLSVGKYDFTTAAGPSFATRRQEVVESMLALSREYPRLAEVAGDLMIGAMDFPMAQEISKRIKKTMPPEVLGEDNNPIPPEIKGQLDQMGNVIKGLTEKLNEAQDSLDDKSMELESKERIEFAKLETQLRIKTAELDTKNGAEPDELSIMAQSIVDISNRLELLNIDQPMNEDEIAENLEQDIAPINNNLPGEMPPVQTDPMIDGE